MSSDAAPFVVSAFIVLLGEGSSYLVQGKVISYYEGKMAGLSGTGPPGWARPKEIARTVAWSLSAAQAFASGIAPVVAALFLIHHSTLLLNVGYVASLVCGFLLFVYVFAGSPEHFPLRERIDISLPGRVAILLNVVLAAVVLVST